MHEDSREFEKALRAFNDRLDFYAADLSPSEYMLLEGIRLVALAIRAQTEAA